jgi:Raf kinase inhibitor-like YbhB/YbcL family protein
MKKVLITLLILFIVLVILFVFLFNSHKTTTQTSSTVQKPSATVVSNKNKIMTISSSVFANNGIIPTNNTCDGKGVNPPLTFDGIPSITKSLAVLMDDRDVPKNLKPEGIFNHWVIYNIEPHVTKIAENSTPPGTQGLNGSGKIGFTPPCPPDREHRYFITLYALDTKLAFTNPTKVTKQMVLDKMQGHIIDQAQLMGRYNRPQNK